MLILTYSKHSWAAPVSLFTHSCTRQILVEFLFCARHCGRGWAMHMSKAGKVLLSRKRQPSEEERCNLKIL